MTDREQAPDIPRHRAAGTSKRRRPGRLTLLRGEGIPAARPRPTPGAAECAQLARELRAECRELREKLQTFLRWLREDCPQPGPGGGTTGRTPRRAG